MNKRALKAHLGDPLPLPYKPGRDDETTVVNPRPIEVKSEPLHTLFSRHREPDARRLDVHPEPEPPEGQHDLIREIEDKWHEIKTLGVAEDLEEVDAQLAYVLMKLREKQRSLEEAIRERERVARDKERLRLEEERLRLDELSRLEDISRDWSSENILDHLERAAPPRSNYTKILAGVGALVFVLLSLMLSELNYEYCYYFC